MMTSKSPPEVSSSPEIQAKETGTAETTRTQEQASQPTLASSGPALASRTKTSYREARYARFFEVVDTVVEEIQSHKWEATGTTKRRLAKQQLTNLKASVEKLIRDSIAVVHLRKRKGDAAIHLNRNWYSSEASGPELGYNIHVERAYFGMVELGYLTLTKRGAFDRSGAKGRANKSRLTRYQATDKLVNMFTEREQEVLPVIVPPAIDHAPLRVRLKNSDGPDKVFAVDNTLPDAQRMLANLERINRVLATRWYDLKISQTEMVALQARLADDPDGGKTLSLDRRSLHRVFNDEAMTTGGRFYGGWWQNIPKEFRRRMIVNEKAMVEIDYSNLHPAILYAEAGVVPPNDCYQGIFDADTERRGGPSLRNLIKRSFNAMINAEKPLRQAPDGIDPKSFGTTWGELSEAILAAHEPIAEHFYTGAGRRLQRIDSDVAERVMLAFMEVQAPILPIHDSFLVHEGYRGRLEEVMRQALEDICGVQTPLSLLEAVPSPLPGGPSHENAEYGDIQTQDIVAIMDSMEGYEKRQDAFWTLGQKPKASE